MKTDDIDKKIGMPNVDEEWVRFEREVIRKTPKSKARTIAAWGIGVSVAACIVLFIMFNLYTNPAIDLKPSNDKPKSSDAVGQLAIYELSPQFPNGGNAAKKYVQENLRYPEKAIEKNIEGRVLVSFYVEKDGSLTDICVVRSPDSLLNEEAIRIVKSMPKWNPGKLGDEIVKMKCSMPIDFKIEPYKKGIAEENFK